MGPGLQARSDGFLADAMDLSAPFVFSAILLATIAATAWQSIAESAPC